MSAGSVNINYNNSCNTKLQLYLIRKDSKMSITILMKKCEPFQMFFADKIVRHTYSFKI